MTYLDKIRFAVRVKGKRCCTGLTIVGRFECTNLYAAIRYWM